MPGRGGHYGGKWPEARAAYLRKHPWCVACLQLGHHVRATDVDHVVPWRQHPGGFWDRKNWASLCSMHHKQKSGREAHGLKPKYGCGADGMPRDPSHHWNRARP